MSKMIITVCGLVLAVTMLAACSKTEEAAVAPEAAPVEEVAPEAEEVSSMEEAAPEAEVTEEVVPEEEEVEETPPQA